jgi:hypothetical protein
MISPVLFPRGQVNGHPAEAGLKEESAHAEGIPSVKTAGRVICSGGPIRTHCYVNTPPHTKGVGLPSMGDYKCPSRVVTVNLSSINKSSY